MPDECRRQRGGRLGDEDGGLRPVRIADDADAVFLNTCSVRENAENKIYHRLEALNAERRKGRKLIIGVLGCMAERVKDDLLENHGADLVAGPDAYLTLPTSRAQARDGQQGYEHRAFHHQRPTATSFPGA